ncbi:hypothetical protein MD273_15925 [Marinobacter pelagius]|uniref:hypothetical protein n=1 Tax=Marinobacter sp. C7 TaxID=2951363 RepID=UPI001EF05122|nr:hypothetical protein [Marinobacter sp. C7]MCG7201223.1 hypothetical protein [Marinobacter sp. C7]
MKTLPLLLALAAITGCASTDTQRYAALDPASSGVPEPLLVILSSEQKAAATESVAEMVADARSAEFFNVYGVAVEGPSGQMVVCGNIRSRDPRGGTARTQPFALSGERAMLLDEATNWGFSNTGREVAHPHRQRPFVGSWWVQCRPQTFSVLVERHQENQRTIQALR